MLRLASSIIMLLPPRMNIVTALVFGHSSITSIRSFRKNLSQVGIFEYGITRPEVRKDLEMKTKTAHVAMRRSIEKILALGDQSNLLTYRSRQEI